MPLIDAEDYFKGDNVPKVHPFQKVDPVNTFTKKYNDVPTPDSQFGYDKDKLVNSNKEYKKVVRGKK
jgi:hypothetical protein